MNANQATTRAREVLEAAIERSKGLPTEMAAEHLHDATHAVVILLRPFVQ